MIQFECPNCQRKLSVKNTHESAIIQCPDCHERFELDVPPEEEVMAADDYEVVEEETAVAAKPARQNAANREGELKTRPKRKKKKAKPRAGVPVAAWALAGLAILVVGVSTAIIYSFATSSGTKDKDAPASAATAADPEGNNATARGNNDEEFIDDDASPEERRFIRAGRPFVVALAKNRPEEAFAQLSSHAKKSMRRFQFQTGDERKDKTLQEEFKDVDAKKFAELFGLVVKRFGTPRSIQLLYCETTDANILAGKANDNFERLDVMFA
ncbi:MAG: hypothetical protein AB7K24_28955, partial [Gemmataceae bacterium]